MQKHLALCLILISLGATGLAQARNTTENHAGCSELAHAWLGAGKTWRCRPR